MRRSFALAVALATLVVAPAAHAWTWPVDGPVLRPFSLGNDPYAGGQHRGVDIGASVGSSVRAPAGGTVSFVGSLPNGGRALTIETADGYAVTLLQLGASTVLRGAVVDEGATVGQVGESEDASTREPHVHLGVRTGGAADGYVDPLGLLPSRGSEPVPPPLVAAVSAPVTEPAAPVTAELPIAVAQPGPTESIPAAPADQPALVSGEADPSPPPTPASGPVATLSPGPVIAAPAPAAIVLAASSVTSAVIEVVAPSAVAPPAPLRVTEPGRRRGPRPARGLRPSKWSRALPTSAPPRLERASVSARLGGSPRAAAGPAQAPGAVATPHALRAGRVLRAERRGFVADHPTIRDRSTLLAPAPAAPAGRSGQRKLLFALLTLIGCLGAAAIAVRARPTGQREARNTVRIMGGDELFATAEDPGRGRVAVCERSAAHRPRGGVRRSIGHLRPLPPAARQPRPDGQRHRRARHARDGRRGSGRSHAA